MIDRRRTDIKQAQVRYCPFHVVLTGLLPTKYVAAAHTMELSILIGNHHVIAYPNVNELSSQLLRF